MDSNKFLRQLDLADPKKFEGRVITLVGAGGIGAPTALELMKMGDFEIAVFDHDGVNEWNQPSTLYGPSHVGMFKVDALDSLVELMTGRKIVQRTFKVPFDDGIQANQVPMSEIVISAVDNMTARKALWEEFKKNPIAKYFIDARMSGEGAQVYSISKGSVNPDLPYSGQWVKDVKFYEDMFFSDAEAVEEKCTAKAIIYNTFMIASLIARSVKGYCVGESVPKEMIFDIKNLIFMTRDE